MRWGKYRIYPKAFFGSVGNPAIQGLLGLKLEKAGGPDIFDIEADPREINSLGGKHAWIVGPHIQIIAAYNQSLKTYPNPPGVSLTGTDFGK